MLLRPLLLIALACGLWSAASDHAAPQATKHPTPAYEKDAPELARKAFAAMDEMRPLIEECAKLEPWDEKVKGPHPECFARLHQAGDDFRNFQRQCLVEYFTSPEHRNPLPASLGKDAEDFNGNIDADWTDMRSSAPQRAGYAYGHAKRIEWLMELCDGAPHRYGGKSKDDEESERKAKAEHPAPKKKP